jgi:transposase
MHSLREILRLSLELKLSGNQISSDMCVSREAVQKCINAANTAGITWSQAADMDDTTLASTLFQSKDETRTKFVEPDWNYVHNELKRRGVTRLLLWKEYVGDSPNGKYSYSQFKRRYADWLDRQQLSMRQEHKAGEKLFVDYAGQTVPVVIDRESGEARMAQVFVAVLGASNYGYADASWSQDLHSWIESHVRALQFLRGAPVYLVPDNLKSGVTEAEPFDPLVNKTYQKLAEHYGCVIKPARKYHPKDKAKVEKGVQVVENWVLARLRNYTFFSLHHLNETIQDLLIEMNNEPFQKMSGSRTSLYRSIDLPALAQLPKTPFEIADWLTGIKVLKDYHVTVAGHHYSVPHQLRGERVDVRYTNNIVEIIHNNVRVASHPRNLIENGQSTLDEHRPPQHALYAGMSVEKFVGMAESVGPFTCMVITAILNAHPNPQMGFDKCFGILFSLRRKYNDRKLEAASEYAIRVASPSYRMVKAALESDNLPEQLTISTIDSHENIRGPREFMH